MSCLTRDEVVVRGTRTICALMVVLYTGDRADHYWPFLATSILAVRHPKGCHIPIPYMKQYCLARIPCYIWTFLDASRSELAPGIGRVG